MDLLEYQGKQLFARHGVPVSPGAPATTVDEAVAAADEIGYPVVVKAQVLIGGRGKAGGIKLADDREAVREHAQNIRSEEHTSELQSRQYLVCRLLLEKKKNNIIIL